MGVPIKEMPLVTVVIPVLNRKEMVVTAVESVLTTNYPALEIVLVDDGSDSDTKDRLESLACRFPQSIRVVAHPDGGNHGPGASRNLGVAGGSGEYVCFLDSDDYVLPHRFSTCVPILEEHPEVDGVYEWTRTELLKGGEERIGKVRRIVSFDASSPEEVFGDILDLRRAWSTNAILLRRKAFLKVGGFSERLRGCEDLVLWFKLAAVCRLVKGTEDPVAVYRIHGSNSATEIGETGLLVNPLLAYLEVRRWATHNGVDRARTGLLEEATFGRLMFICDALRQAREPIRALGLLLRSALEMPILLKRYPYWSNLCYTVVEALHRSKATEQSTVQAR